MTDVQAVPHAPSTMRPACELLAASRVARQALGDEVVDPYTHRADIELGAFASSITGWERYRGFARL